MSANGLAELVLIVADVQTSARFYREVIGLVPHREPSEDWAWFWAGKPGVNQRIALHNGPLLFEEYSPLSEGERWGRVHFALSVPRGRLDPAVEHVRASGVAVYGPTYFEWMKALSYYFYDPDGNLVEYWSPDEDGEAVREAR